MSCNKTLKDNYDVVIVGFGPVGATLANLLGKCGVNTLVIDREAAAYHLPRAVHFDDEVMRVFQTIGLGNEVVATLRVNPGMRFVDPEGTLLLDWPRPQEITAQGWHASYRCHQPDLERILRDGLNRFPNVDVRTRCEANAVVDEGEKVVIECTDLSDNSKIAVTAKYVVGCDGANSLIRKTIGPDMEDFGFNERWLVVDVLLKQDKPSLGDHSIQYCNPERPVTYVRGPGNRRRWEITVLDHENSEEIAQPAAVWNLLKPWISEDEAELERTAVYTFNSQIVWKWRGGRLMVAGDAAHLTPPFMGQGMCAGIRDVSNLGWKLALCVKNKADDALLDTYAIERHPHVKAYIQTAVRLGGLINTCGTEEALHAAFKTSTGPARMESITPRLGVGLAAGNTSATGKLFAQPRLNEGVMADDCSGYAPVLYVDRSKFNATDWPEALIADKGLKVVSTSDSSDLEQYLSELDAAAVLARPDRYIQGTATSSAELIELVEATPCSPELAG